MIFSPFLKCLSKEIFFEKLFTILINLEELENIDIKNEYISIFNDLNKINAKYSSLSLNITNKSNKNIITEINIDYNKIQKLILNNDLCSLSEILFSLDSIKNNLICLDIYYSNLSRVNPQSLQNLNELGALKVLNLINIDFTENFTIKQLSSLISLKLDKCNNISFCEKSYENMKILNIKESKLNYSGVCVEFPNLEKLIYGDNYPFLFYSNKSQNLNNIINFYSLEKLKYFQGELWDFLQIKIIAPLKKVILYSPNRKSISSILKKLIRFKILEEIKLDLYDFKDFSFLEKFQQNNNSVKNVGLQLYMVKDNVEESLITYLEDKFPNLYELSIRSQHLQNFTYNGKNILEIEENPNCKVNIFELNLLDFNHIKIYCCPFENLVKVGIYCHEIKNIKSFFPIFNDKCNKIFKSLKTFSFSIDEVNIDIFNNLYNNLECMPNLEQFHLKIIVDIEEECYKKFIKELLPLNLYELSITLNYLDDYDYDSNCYSKDEIKEMMPGIDMNKFKKIKISKYKTYISFLTGEEEKYKNLKYNYISETNNEITNVKKDQTNKKNKKCQII